MVYFWLLGDTDPGRTESIRNRYVSVLRVRAYASSRGKLRQGEVLLMDRLHHRRSVQGGASKEVCQRRSINRHISSWKDSRGQVSAKENFRQRTRSSAGLQKPDTSFQSTAHSLFRTVLAVRCGSKTHLCFSSHAVLTPEYRPNLA